MKTLRNIIIIIIIILILGFLIKAWENTSKNPTASQSTNTDQTSSIVGCYAATNGNDAYTLDITSNEGGEILGALTFDNFEKDSSSGTFKGTYNNGILLGDYTFQSEGTQSVMQVIFKRDGQDFIRGYGDVDSATGTHFTDLNHITYDSSSTLSVFKNEQCLDSSSSKIIFPQGGENLVMGNTYTLKWSGGPNPTQIFLIDTKLKSAGVSVSLTDRVYNIKNTGSYAYTIPKNINEGMYELEIGNTTSKDFNIVKTSS